jgi:hypothetical protein
LKGKITLGGEFGTGKVICLKKSLVYFDEYVPNVELFDLYAFLQTF